MATLRAALSTLLLLICVTAAAAQPDYFGNYQLAPDRLVGIDRFIFDNGEPGVLFSDYQSGVVRRLFPVSETELVMGPGFETREPVELKIRVTGEGASAASGLSIEPTGGSATVARRVKLTSEDVVIVSDEQTKLAGTLMLPAAKGPHPAIILLHGSGPLTRWSFGPYPHFFTSLGFAVLVYDKRGTGTSTGTRLRSALSASTPRPTGYYPDELVNDGIAAFDFLRNRPEIDPRQIGFWGSSEGGMLSLQIAARKKDVAFAINTSGPIGPFWETSLYQSGASLMARGFSTAQAEEAREFARLWIDVARTGENFELFLKKRAEILGAGKRWALGFFPAEYTSAEQMRWEWDHLISFDSAPALANVTCPVLGLYGAGDVLVDASAASQAMRRLLSESGHKDFTIKVFANAGHSLGELPSGSRMAPGVFEVLRSWLLKHVQIAKAPTP